MLRSLRTRNRDEALIVHMALVNFKYGARAAISLTSKQQSALSRLAEAAQILVEEFDPEPAPSIPAPYQAVYEYTLAHGGGTFLPLVGLEPLAPGRAGYVVGGVPGAPSEKVTGPQGIQAFAEKHATLLGSRRHGFYLGTWQLDNGDIVLDVVQIIQRRETALAAARQRGEYAIWDNEASVVILTGCPSKE